MYTIQKNENRNNNQKPVIRYLLYLLLVAVLVSGVAFSRYNSTLAGQDSARVAVFAYGVSVERNGKDSELKSDNKGREFTSGSFLSTASSQSTAFAVSIYATSKLREADQCEFDDVARVLDLKFSNNSEVKVQALLSGMTEMKDNGIVWCLFNEGEFDSNKDIYDNIAKKLEYNSLLDVPDSYAALKTKLQSQNATTLAEWDSNAALIPNIGTKTLTFVIWAEHDGVKDYDGWDFISEGPFEQPIEINFTVTQVD